MEKPRGRPPKAAVLVDGKWTMTQEALTLAAERLESHRTACRERYRLTQQLLREQKPELFRNVSRTVSRDLRDTQL